MKTFMNHGKDTKQSANVKFFWLVCLFLLSASVSNLSRADTLSQKEIAKLYQQAFGQPKKVNLPATRPIQKTRPKEKTYNTSDLAALYSQTFDNKKSKAKKPTSKKQNVTPQDLSALYAQAFGKKSVTIAPPKITVDLRVNKAVLGEVILFSNKFGEMSSAKSSELLSLLKSILKEHVYQRIEKKIGGLKKVSFDVISTNGLVLNYNSVNLSLDLTVKPELRKPRVLSLQNKKTASVRNENKISAEEVSAFLNMYSNAGFSSVNGNTDTDFRMKLEGSVGVKNVVLESTVDLKNKRWDIGRTTLTFDKPDKLQRFVIGDISTGSRNFQENFNLKGFRASKEFFMKPELQIRPQANQNFILETESEVEVFINNQLRQRFFLQEGIYSLEDIGLYNGANNINVKITDAFGKVTIKKSQHYYDSHLLKPELSLFSISVGYLSKKQSYIKETLEQHAVISGYYERGLAKNLTMSLDFQLSQNDYLLGTEAITSLPFGSLKYSFATSGGENKALGYATRFELKPNIQRELIILDTLKEDMLKLDTKVGRFINSWTITGEYRSEDFSTLNKIASTSKNSKKLKAQLQSQFSLDLSDRWLATLNLGVTDYYEDKSSVSANLVAIKRFNNGVRVSLGAAYDSREDFSMNLQLSIPLDPEPRSSKRNIELLANTKSESYTTRLNLRPTSLVGRNSLAGSIEYSQVEASKNAKLNFKYRDPKFSSQLMARTSQNTKKNANIKQLSLGFNTSIACVGSHCGTSYPVDDSFALVKGPSNQDQPIAINDGNGQFKYTSEGNLPDNYTALIPKKGAYAVVPLTSYRYQTINIDESTLPSGYDSEKTEFEVFPRYHQGFLVKAGGEPSTIIDGMLVDKANKPLGFKGGQWVSQAEKGKTIAFFSNKAGRFRINSIPAGKYKLELFDYPYMQNINIKVPDKKGQVHDLGSLVVKE